MKHLIKNNSGSFTIIGLVIAIAIMLLLVSMFFGSGTANNTESVAESNETTVVASTVYNAAQIYLSTQQSMGKSFQPNGTIPASDIAGALPENCKTVEIKLDSKGSAVKYVYIETNDGAKQDYPSGASGKIK